MTQSNTLTSVGRGYSPRWVRASIRELRDHTAADFAATTERIAWLTGQVVDAPDVQLCFGVRDGPIDDPLDGWRPVMPYRFGPNAEPDATILSQWYRSTEHQAADPLVQALVRTSGRPRVFLSTEVGNQAAWRRSEVIPLLGESGIRDRLVAATPLTDGVELLLVAYRRSNGARFDSSEREGMLDLASSLGEAGTAVARAHALIDGREPLSLRERDVLRLLLLGFTETAAAVHAGLTVRSFHQHVVAIYRKLGVHSRGELAAHFLAPRRRKAAMARYSRVLQPPELNVLKRLIQGLSEKQIADDLRLTTRAVHHLVGAVYRKTGTHTRAALLAEVLGAGFGPKSDKR